MKTKCGMHTPTTTVSAVKDLLYPLLKITVLLQ